MARIINRLPDTLCHCHVTAKCVYKKVGECDQPRTYKGNSDSACFNMPNQVLALHLTEIKHFQKDGWADK